MKYRPEIDGLRAIAVLPVILFHANLPPFSGGFLGVDIFFVISGYLITTILLQDIDRRRSFTDFILHFYERRARRILPALFLVLAVTTAFAFAWLDRQSFKDYAQSLSAVLLFYSNFHFAETLDYFAGPSNETPLLHTWSLAVEEQFYLLFPPLLYVILRLARRYLVPVLLIAAMASLIWGEVMVRGHVQGTFYLPHTRAFELLAGSLCAVYLLAGRGKANDLLAGVGLAILFAAMVIYDETTQTPGLAALPAVIGSAMVILFAAPQGLTGRVLASGLFRGIGLISYSAYLWHQPLFAFARIHSVTAPGAGLMAALCLLTLGLAYLSWKFVETPFRRPSGAQAGYNKRALIAVAMVIVAAALTAEQASRKQVLARLFPEREFGRYVADNNHLQRQSWKSLRDLSGGSYAVNGNAFDRTLWFKDEAKDDILLVGNSHSKDLYNALVESPYRDRFEFARFGAERLDSANLADLWTSPNYLAARYVLIATRYDESDVDAVPALVERIKADQKTPVIVLNTVEFPGSRNATLADKLIGRMTIADDTSGWDDQIAKINHQYFLNIDPEGRVAGLNRRLGQIGQSAGVTVLDRADYICAADQQLCFGLGPDFAKHFFDYGHTTLEGGKFFGDRIGALHWLDPVFTR